MGSYRNGLLWSLDGSVDGERVVPHGTQLDHEIFKKQPVLVHIVVAIADRVSPVVDALGEILHILLEIQKWIIRSKSTLKTRKI